MSTMFKIGLVDDNIFMLNSVEEKLSLFEDIKIKSSNHGGAELLESLEEDNNYDLILMDIEMPGLNGVETTAIVKKKYPKSKSSCSPFLIMMTIFLTP